MTKKPTSATPTPKPWISAIKTYVAGKAVDEKGQKIAKLSANENPLGTSKAACEAFRSAAEDLAHYPDPSATALREAIAAKYAIDPSRIICGAGSDELLHLAASGFAGPGDEILFMRHGFVVYELAARRVGAKPVEVKDTDYATNVDGLLAAVNDRTRVVYLANPNNPTGTLASTEEIERLHAGLRSDILFVLDQAYNEYLDPYQENQKDQIADTLALAKQARNVLITRTFSKIYGLAAERIGWGYADSAIIETLNRIRAPFNITRCGQAAALAALGDEEFVNASRIHNHYWREWLKQEVEKINRKISGQKEPKINPRHQHIRAVPSAANFLLILFESARKAAIVHQALMKAGYIVRDFPQGPLAHALRITIGTEDQMRGIVTTMRSTLTSAAFDAA